jgi:quinol monooxygenase YgiN
MIHSTIRIVINPEQSDEAVTILGMMAEKTRIISGCIACRTYRDVHEGDIIMFEAIWENEEYMNHHLRSDEFRHLLLAMEMGVEMPEIRFATVSQVTGMETIEKARNAGWKVE